MTAMTLFGIIILLVAVALVVTVVLQEGKNNGLSGAIAGGSADTFLGKSKAATKQQNLARLTTVLAVAFVALVLAMHITHLATTENYEYQEPTNVTDTDTDEHDHDHDHAEEGEDAGADTGDESAE